MAEKNELIDIPLSDYEEPGLYLTLEDSTRLVLTRQNIEKTTETYWADQERIPGEVREAVEFQRCGFCPLKRTEDLCDALRPILPWLQVIDKYSSFDEATVVYRVDQRLLYHVSYTTMQQALRYISNLSLIDYCQVGRKYRRYYYGILPMMETEEIVNRLYLNMYWTHGGDEEAIDRLISTYKKEITITTQNQMKRLRLICKNDAFQNAFVLTHLIPDLLYDIKDAKLRERLAGIEKSG